MADYSELIPTPDELSQTEKVEPDYNQWMRRTLKDIANKIRKAATEGKLEVTYVYPILQSKECHEMWLRHYTDVERVLNGRGYTTLSRGSTFYGHEYQLDIFWKRKTKDEGQPE